VFYGEFRGDEHAKHHLHESPASMTMPLWILMGGSIVAGFLWIPNVWTPFEHWLEPVLGGHHAPAHGHGAHHDVGLELALMALSVVVALAGIGFAFLMYRRGTIRPERFTELAGGAPYRLVLNKYWVDEIYELVFVRGLALGGARVLAWFDATIIDGIVNASGAVCRGVSWVIGLFDSGVVDGAVNGVADSAWTAGRSVRRLQSGAITAYLYVIAFGVLGSVLLYWSMAVAS